MQSKLRELFTTIRTEGALLPPDLLLRIADQKSDLAGLTPTDYHLSPGERINEVISRAWNRLLGAWASFRAGIQKLPAGDNGTVLTRERWLLILFQELGYGRLLTTRALEIEGKTYPISHLWQHTPIHLVGCRIDLDKRTAGVAGASRQSPHSLVQELLNRSDQHLWGMVSNGLRLRILRNNISLTRQSYVEFDLEAMMEGQVYADFVLLWLLCHQSRLEGERPADCWLEKWTQTARDQGTRALDQLRNGVEQAIAVLGRGFLSHPANRILREKLQSGQLDKQDYYRQLLRLVYRLIFLFVAEDRDLLLQPLPASVSPTIAAARERYTRYYSTARLRRLAGKRKGSHHVDLYRGLLLIMEKLEAGCPELALPALGSFLWSSRAVPDLLSCDLANRDLLDAVYALSFTNQDQVQRLVDYKNLGAEELGSIYESLLELHPEIHVEAAAFELHTAGGNERKTTGSYYTPTGLINCLLDSALEPVLDRAVQEQDPEAAILNLKICDPACGSGHFLIAAAHRMARRLAAVRTGDPEPAPAALRKALRDVIGRCIYGVDINEMAVELCKVSLWMEALEPGKPLSFLDHRIQCGNSLLGTTPALLNQGIPDEAFNPIEGDVKKICQDYKKINKKERQNRQTSLFDATGVAWPEMNQVSSCLAGLDRIDDGSLEGIRSKEERYLECVSSRSYRHSRLLADAWCAAFVWKKTTEFPYPITESVFRKLEQNPAGVPEWMRQEINRLAKQYQFFHWHLAFPEVFRLPGEGEKPENEQTGWSGGFDVVLGNPPWEQTELKEKEWFATCRPDIANATTGAARKRMITELAVEDPVLYGMYINDLRKAEGISHFIRSSGRYPLCGRGRINTYAIFAEAIKNLNSTEGRIGCIVPSGIATDDTTKFFFRDLMDKRSLVSFYDFENREKLFPAVDSRMKFCLLTLTGTGSPADKAEFVFFAHLPEDLQQEERRFTLSAEDIALLNPNTRTCPIFRSKRDAELTKSIYRRVPVLIKEGPPEENPWGITFKQGLFNMTSDSHLFRTRQQLEEDGWQLEGNIFKRDGEVYLPLYEAKMLHHFDHRWATYEGLETRDLNVAEKEDPTKVVLPRYWVDEIEVMLRISQVPPALKNAFSMNDEKLCNEALYYWIAGYRFNRGEDLTHLPGDLFKSMPELFTDRLATKKLEQDFPLQDADIWAIHSSSTALEAAEKIIRNRTPEWLVGFRDITNTTNERTAIFSVLPRAGVGNKFPITVFERANSQKILCLYANYNSFCVDYVARQKIGGTSLNFFYLKQFPVLADIYDNQTPWNVTIPLVEWLFPRVLEITYTAWDLQPFAQDCGYDGPPFRWDEERRFKLRCELDAAYFHLYGIARENVDYIMETFPIVKRKDEEKYGSYRTKELILTIYDAMQQAIDTGQPYQTILDPPPADPRCAHPPRQE